MCKKILNTIWRVYKLDLPLRGRKASLTLLGRKNIIKLVNKTVIQDIYGIHVIIKQRF